ncbi:hypothetical protein OG883_39235 [Streptomyces sp. NBC_01142]|uniref:hypothetical protein n=1 Tax=Streptomyces sp. NBC_01142 TaxID=2975865 RepID=UPI00224D24BF|nr:hypothetical protein [Streptomyces sp. NBC_01142]MCX4825770.1 hypothetical protein [Streptomyces sp. NBC_01142]
MDRGQAAEDAFHFYAEVRVVSSPRRPALKGRLGAILGITEPTKPDIPPAYAVMLDDHDFLVQFEREELQPTGRDRKQDDY